MLLRSTAPVFDMSTAPRIARKAHISRSNWGSAFYPLEMFQKMTNLVPDQHRNYEEFIPGNITSKRVKS